MSGTITEVRSGDNTPGLSVTGYYNTVQVDSGGTVTGLYVADNADAEIFGAAYGTTVGPNGMQSVDPGGYASGTILSGAGSEEDVDSGTSVDAIISSGGSQDPGDGGYATGAVVYAGGNQVVGGLTVLGQVNAQASATDTTLSGGLQLVISGAIATGTQVLAGGVELIGLDANDVVSGPDLSIGTNVNAGGTEVTLGFTPGATTVLTAAGVVAEAVVASGSTQSTTYGPLSPDLNGYTAVLTDDGAGTVYRVAYAPGGGQVGTTHSEGGTINLPGDAQGTTVLSGGTFQFAGGSATNLIVQSGGTISVGGTVDLGGGYGIAETNVVATPGGVGNGVTEIIGAGGSARSGTISSGGLLFVTSGGEAIDTMVLSGGKETVSSGAQDLLTIAQASGGGSVIVQSGASQVVSAGGVAVATDVAGTQYVSSGGAARSTTVESGALLYIESGGTATGGTVSAGGTLYVESGATASGITVLSGGIEYDLNGGTDEGDTVSQGGTLYVSSGADEGVGVSDGGTEVVLAGGSAGGIKVDNSGVLSFSDSTATGANTVYAGGVTVFTGSATAGTAGFEVAGTGPALVTSVQSDTSSTGPFVFPRLEAVNFANASQGAVLFQGSSTAGGATINVSSGGFAWFEDTSTAGSATITASNTGVGFTNSSTAGGATIALNGSTLGLLVDGATLGSSTLTLSATATSGGVLLFANSATAGAATIDNVVANSDVGGLIAFAYGTTAGTATINNQARTTTDLSRALDAILKDLGSGGSVEVAAFKGEQAIAQFPEQSAAPIGGLIFFDGSTAGAATINNTGTGLTDFISATAGGATITNSGSMSGGGTTVFFGAGAGSATITDEMGGAVAFGDHASGGTAHIANQPGGLVVLHGDATLGSAQVDNDGAIIAFGGTAGASTITNGGAIIFAGDSTLGSATVSLAANSLVALAQQADGGTAQLTTTDQTAQLDISGDDGAASIGSIAGPGTFKLGGNTLKVGSANTTTTVTGLVTNDGIVNVVTGLHFPDVKTIGGEATLDKVGTGTLTLAGAIYETNLVAEKGTLDVTGPITGPSTALIKTTGTVELGGASAENVTFATGATGTLQLEDPAEYTGTVAGFGIAQTILLNEPAAAGATATVATSGSGATLTVSNGGQSTTLQLADASLAGRTVTASATGGMLALTISARIIDTPVTVADGETLSGAVVVSGGSITVEQGGLLSASVVASGGTISVQDGGKTSGNTINDGGHETVEDGGTAWDTYINDPGLQTVLLGATVNSAQVSGGEQDVYGLATSASVASGGIQVAEPGGTLSASLIGSGGVLVLSGGTVTSATLAVSGAVDFPTLAYDSAGSATFDPASHTLTVSAGGLQQSISLANTTDFATFHLLAAGAMGTLVEAQSIACYVTGTLISTEAGEIPVEALRAGNLVRTVSGALRPVQWVGHRAYAGRFLRANPRLHPVRFRAGSLGTGLPRRDLLVSRNHAMLLDGYLVPAEHLTNGTTISIDTSFAQLKYFHIELATHDAVLAEGAASETFVDDDSSGMFHNAQERPTASRPAIYCRARLEEGFQLEAIRRRLNCLPALLRPRLDGRSEPDSAVRSA